ncbi:MAG: hypothetical protein CMM76_13510 [Rhodospirillaceae bacterium]|nr:hypothetical protein [Rhodospirillaceae bacterium]
MRSRLSMLKGLSVGDLVYYRLKPGIQPSSSYGAGEHLIDKKRIGLIVSLQKRTAMGFQMVEVMWNDSGDIDIIAENYLHKINETT